MTSLFRLLFTKGIRGKVEKRIYDYRGGQIFSHPVAFQLHFTVYKEMMVESTVEQLTHTGYPK